MRSATVSHFFTLIGIILMLLPTYSAAEKIDTNSFTGAYLAGRIANYENKMNLAIHYFQQALTYKPNNLETQKEIFQAMLSVGAFTEAVRQAKKLKEKNIITPLISLTLSIENLIKKNYKEAQLLLQAKTSISDNNLIFELTNAWTKFESGNQFQAITDLEKRLGPTWYNFFIHYHLALMSDLAKRPQDAKKYFIQALKNQQGAITATDTYERVIIAYASFQLRQHMRNDAIKTLKYGEKILLGYETLKNIRQKVEKGANIENLITTPQQGIGEVLYNFGTIFNKKGSERIARIFQQFSLVLYPKNEATLFQLAKISAKFDDYDQAIKIYRALPPNSPYYRDGQFQLALTLTKNGNRDEAIKLLILLEKKFPNDRHIIIALAAIYMQENNFPEAIKILDQAIAKIKDFQRDNWKLFYQRGIAFNYLKQWSKAETDFRKALTFFPDQPQVLNYLAYSLIDRNQKLEESLNMLKKAITLQSQNSYILDSLGWAYYKLKQYSQAVRTLETAVRLQPSDPIINDHLGDAYWQVGCKREAIFQWNHAIDGEPENPERIKEKIKFGL
ncbi:MULTISPECIES: tetratricopeptide repeat protein [unclassified Bartonella]|uniref:tetratricopeptide repeat protein n=1 Tax=unclassified Bartonella TaxID=2645622 RepID=UPI00099A650F|nr:MULTISPECIES: tetratricopeptide repeat protein [unclassified Bartonella]AQX28298.1 Tetratricopeptide repeat-containing protein [Bartonella sp. JB15]AQX29569.1 Tetratricopeptide repeat-containing protein [Bartonella sp. JB63]